MSCAEVKLGSGRVSIGPKVTLCQHMHRMSKVAESRCSKSRILGRNGKQDGDWKNICMGKDMTYCKKVRGRNGRKIVG